ncbi:putative nucleic acid-binding protein [Herbihabitans rhizosphaerae]|uniref:Putative nucleic acid-binding protein n=1 Tax=Herbihabitans rhizosphaerae TaxID=1872711 RepID=A0A4Q7L626_9PSEU|nr:PIN domain-containing protein [Herbihabitans rhizosphaerae]RZS45128.1 putative nucleic acid-binding protein [Herbihabitans rhizosphaerae]
MLPIILDSDGLSALSDDVPSVAARAILTHAWADGRDVLVPAVVCAEVARGTARTRRVETAIAGRQVRGRPRQAVQVVDTDLDLAKGVGAVLHGAKADSRDIVDAHVVAVAVRHGGGLVITSDSDDILRLSAATPTARISTRRAR